MAFYQIYYPTGPLTSLIRDFQISHMKFGEEDLAEPFITCLANTEQALYFYVNDPIKIVPAASVEIPVPPVVITGPKYKPIGLLFGQNHLMIKCTFHPTGTYRLLGLQMKETVNNGLDAANYWGNEVNKVLQQLREASSYDSMIDIVALFILGKYDDQCRPEEPIDQIAAKMLNPLDDHTIDEWASMACLSLRQFERSFMTRIGISPKLFIRIVRFEYAMEVKNNFPDKNWSQIALECGYTDSSHILKEFRTFAEFPPSRFYLQPSSGYSTFPTG